MSDELLRACVGKWGEAQKQFSMLVLHLTTPADKRRWNHLQITSHLTQQLCFASDQFTESVIAAEQAVRAEIESAKTPTPKKAEKS